MSFALYRRPGTVIFLDDDPDYLEMLGEVMPSNWQVRFLLRPIACIQILTSEIAQTDLDMWRQQEIINNWRGGALLIPQILQYWRDDGAARFGLTKVCVVDYSMPAMSGLKVLSELENWLGLRVLLTGRADEQLAVSAFNRGLIQQFVPKQLPEIRRRLTEAIQGLLDKADPRNEQIWRATLSREQIELLGDDAIAETLRQLASRQNWIEHVVIGSPFGVLALTSAAQAEWLQLEPSNRLIELAEMTESQGWSANAVQEVRLGSKLIDLELQLALGAGQKATLKPAVVMGCGSKQIYAAIFSIDGVFCPAQKDSHQQFLLNSDGRNLQD